MSVQIAIEEINQQLKKSFSSVVGAAFYGLSELFQKKDKTTPYSIPGIASRTGEITYVGFDDRNPLIIYHRLNSASQTERTGSSYGDDRTDQITNYALAMFVYADRKVVCATQTDLLETIQASLPDTMVISGYKGIVVRILSVNFTTANILRQEYPGTDAKLRPERVLIQINYQIETTARKKCLTRCA